MGRPIDLDSDGREEKAMPGMSLDYVLFDSLTRYPKLLGRGWNISRMGGTDLDFIYVVYKRGVYEDLKVQ